MRAFLHARRFPAASGDEGEDGSTRFRALEYHINYKQAYLRGMSNLKDLR